MTQGLLALIMSCISVHAGLRNVTSFGFLRAEPPFMNIPGTRVLGMITRGMTGSGINLFRR